MLLSVQDLRTYFAEEHRTVRAVDGVSFDLARGETLGIVGESGSGKSVTNLSIMRLVPIPPGRIVSGRAVFDGRDLLALPEADLRRIRGKRIAMIFQDPMTSLNPFMRISEQLMEVTRLHLGHSRGEARAHAVAMLESVGIPDARRRIDAYPHEFSGGMRQRVMIAMALSCRPELLIADEPTTALDVTIQAQILDLIQKLKRETGTSVILITHDLGRRRRHDGSRHRDVRRTDLRDRAGTAELFARPANPYTNGLLLSVPDPTADAPDRAVPDSRAAARSGQPAGRLPVRRALLPRGGRSAARPLPPFVSAGARSSLALPLRRRGVRHPTMSAPVSNAPLVRIDRSDRALRCRPARSREGRRRRLARYPCGRDARPRRRIRLRQDARWAAPCSDSWTSPAAACCFDGRRSRRLSRRALRLRPPPHADDLPGSVRLARSAHDRGADHRRAHRNLRSRARRREARPRAGADAHGRAERPVHQPLPARVLRRAAAAHRDRARARRRPGLHRRRRADLGAGRLDSGADHQPDRAAPAGAPADVSLHFARPARDPPHLAPGRGDVSRTGRRARRRATDVRRSADAVHEGADLGGAGAGPAASRAGAGASCWKATCRRRSIRLRAAASTRAARTPFLRAGKSSRDWSRSNRSISPRASGSVRTCHRSTRSPTGPRPGFPERNPRLWPEGGARGGRVAPGGELV